jgi:non-heme chloroperoxidase
VDASVFAGIEKAVAADRYAFFTEFFKNFYNTDVFLGKWVSEQAVRASWNWRPAPPPPPAWRVSQPGMRTSAGILTRIDVPTLVIHGDADRILPITTTGLRTAKLIKGARLLVVKDGPHCIPWTHAEEVNAELLSFLGGKAGKSQSQSA